jgi:hypothetical protein
VLHVDFALVAIVPSGGHGVEVARLQESRRLLPWTTEGLAVVDDRQVNALHR